jgi:hypothetical protein
MDVMTLMIRTENGPYPAINNMLKDADDSAFFRCPKCGYFQYLTVGDYARGLVKPLTEVCPMQHGD